MLMAQSMQRPPYTLAVRQALQGVNDSALEADLLFLEAWEMHPSSHLGATLRASQIRRANPGLSRRSMPNSRPGVPRPVAERRRVLRGS